LGNFFGKADNNEIRKKEIKKSEYETISKAKDYLLNNINNPFPSIVFLANLAGMSQSKFKILFQKCYNSTPNSFFVQKKMEYAYTLLQSGNYNKLLEIVYELSYSKTGYFTSKYTEIYGHSPADDFIKKTTNS
jgi:AraC-like DNA-binding protein